MDPATVLTDPAYPVPPVPDGGPPGGIRWLRRSVARFAEGAAHQRRRSLVTTRLEQVIPDRLRALAAEHATALRRAGVPLAGLITRLPVDVLVTTLNLPPLSAADVALVAAAYLPGTGDEVTADPAVARLAHALPWPDPEEQAAVIGLLTQAQVGTAALIRAALAETGTPAERVTRALATNPPVRATRRRTPTGADLTVDLTAHPFGAGRHTCPAHLHAPALAEGAVSALTTP